MPEMEYPSWNDSMAISWQKISRNFYALAADKGFSGIEPNALDSEPQSQKKVIIYTAFLAETY